MQNKDEIKHPLDPDLREWEYNGLGQKVYKNTQKIWSETPKDKNEEISENN